MKRIKYSELRDQLFDLYGSEKNKRWRTFKTILRIRRFSSRLKEAFCDFFNSQGKVMPSPDLKFGGVTFQELVEEEGMNALQAFLMLDWFDRDPEDAMEYMSRYRFRSPMYIDGEDLKEIERKLKESGYQPPVDEAEKDTSDIVVETAVEDIKA